MCGFGPVGNELLVIMPSRGRAANFAGDGGLIDRYAQTCTAGTQVFVALDDDDPDLLAYHEVLDGSPFLWSAGPRKTFIDWTNSVAGRLGQNYKFLASLNDDMFPVTRCWADELMETIGGLGHGTGIAYPNDLRRDDVPEAPVVSGDIVDKLGWLLLPQCQHYYGDTALGDIGRGAGCLFYRPDVIVEHRHPTVNRAVMPDNTYVEAARGLDADANAYRQWRRDPSGLKRGVADVRHLSEQARARVTRQ